VLHSVNVCQRRLLCGVIRMFDLSNLELVGFAVDAVVVYLLNRLYKNRVRDADLVLVSEVVLY